MNFVHANHIIHRDLKPSNIVVDAHNRLKVVDWGLARVFRTDKRILYESGVGTAWYRSPELILGANRTTHGYGPAIDMWAFGCIFVELLWREMGGIRLRRALMDPRVRRARVGGGLARHVSDEELELPPGISNDKNAPSFITAPYTLMRNITNKLGVPTPAPDDWPACDKLPRWADFERQGLTTAAGEHQLRAAKRREFEGELRMSAMTPEAIDLALQLLELDPRKRVAANAVLVHPYFSPFQDGKITLGGAVRKPEALPLLQGLDKAHSNKLRRAAERKGAEKQDDLLGED